MSFKLREYQVETAESGTEILKRLGILYLAMECRTGKTLTSLAIAQKVGAKKVLFLTKKEVRKDIEKDWNLIKSSVDYELIILNNEILFDRKKAREIAAAIALANPRKKKKKPLPIMKQEFIDMFDGVDLLIHDEHHRVGAFPEANESCQLLKRYFSGIPQIYLSGTPSPENFSQLYHQFSISQRSPFPQASFYRWADLFVNVKKKYIGGGERNDYSDAKWELIERIIKPYMVSLSQAEAGFTSELKEHIIRIPQPPSIKKVAERMLADKVVRGTTGTASASNAAALQQKIHQIHSGTIILDPEEGEKKGRRVVLDAFKAREIAKRWPTEKLVIFYCFTGELDAVVSVLGDRVTNDVQEFRDTDKSIAVHIVKGREGLNLSAGEAIIFYNIPFSALSYWQGRDRLTTKERIEANIYWLMSDGGIEEKIYGAVQGKKDYTLAHFKKDFKVANAKPKQLKMEIAA
jgi:hypothetical protein